MKEHQLSLISEFCNDIAKGLMLGAFIGQGFLGNLGGIQRLTMMILWISASFIFLFFSIQLSQEQKL